MWKRDGYKHLIVNGKFAKATRSKIHLINKRDKRMSLRNEKYVII